MGFAYKGLSDRRLIEFAAILNKRFGKRTVLDYAGLKLRADGIGATKRRSCKCACGRVVDVFEPYLRNGDTASCGSCNDGRLAPAYSTRKDWLRRQEQHQNLAMNTFVWTANDPRVQYKVVPPRPQPP